MLLYFEDQAVAATALAAAARLPCHCLAVHRFPDGEVKLRLPRLLPERVAVYRSLHHPNEKLVELLLTAQTARTLGARHLTLIAPYLAYMRQDMAFHPGEAISQRVVGRFLSTLFDAAITVDPHLHRVATLGEAIPLADAIVLTGAGLLSDHIVLNRERPMLVGPDEESAQWVAVAAHRHGLDHAVCHKVRRGDREVSVVLQGVSVEGRAVVIMDDVGSTGNTLAAAARLLRRAGARSVDAAVTHALFGPGAVETVHAAGVDQIWSTDCIAHASNAVGMAPLIAEALDSIAVRTLR